MPYALVAKPGVLKNGEKQIILQLTDTAAHTAAKTPTPSLGKKIQKAVEADQPDRMYFPFDPLLLINGRDYVLNRLQQDPDFLEFVRAKEEEGYKVLISIPKGGPPLGLGKDTVEFLKGKNGKRFLRGIAKEKRKE